MHIRKQWSSGGFFHLLSPIEHPGKCEEVIIQHPKESVDGISKKASGKEESPGFFINPGKSLSLLLLLLSLSIIAPEEVKLLHIYEINYIKTGVFSFFYNVLYGLSIWVFKVYIIINLICFHSSDLKIYLSHISITIWPMLPCFSWQLKMA